MKETDISYRTMFAELAQQTMDAQFVADKDRDYWYFDLPTSEGKDQTKLRRPRKRRSHH